MDGKNGVTMEAQRTVLTLTCGPHVIDFQVTFYRLDGAICHCHDPDLRTRARRGDDLRGAGQPSSEHLARRAEFRCECTGHVAPGVSFIVEKFHSGGELPCIGTQEQGDSSRDSWMVS